MLWARMVAYVTGTVNQELLLRNECLGAENRILRGHRSRVVGPNAWLTAGADEGTAKRFLLIARKAHARWADARL
jgi:hypothetical protein